VAQTCGSTGPYTCPTPRCFNAPKTFEIAVLERPDPVPAPLLPFCPSPGSGAPCIVPATPVEDTSIPRRAQEITFKAEIPTASICPQYIRWLLEWKDGTTWRILYEFESPDALKNEFEENGKLMTRLGAPGLVPNKEHRVSVAYACQYSPPEYPSSTCFSDPAYDGTNADGSPRGFIPTAFRGGSTLPKVPPDFVSGTTSYQEMEDSFTRPSTTSKRKITAPFSIDGDGLGPDSVWLDSNPYGSNGNGSRVVAASGGNYYAYLPQSATGQYAAEFSNPNSFVEALFGRDSVGSGGTDVINFELHTRQFMDGSTVRSYWVKLLKNRLGAGSQPRIVIGAPTCLGEINGTPEPLPAGWTCNSVGSLTWMSMKSFDIPETRPSGMPSTDPNYNCYGAPSVTAGSNEKVWLQIQVKDDELLGDNPHVYAVAAWDPDSPTSSCSTGSDIGGCPRVCRVDVLDETLTLGGIMEGQKGHARYFAHDANYRAWVIRAGSKP
jgi:hypothetical protein